MFNFLKAKKAPEQPSFLERLKTGLSKTRAQFTNKLSHLLLGKKELDAEVFEILETQLLQADVGVEATQALLKSLTEKTKRKELSSVSAALETLKTELRALLQPCEVAFELQTADKPFLILMVGINGAGKTTTLGKLAHYFKNQGLSLLLAAGDTFRAAAIEQLQVWGERNQIPVIAQKSGSDTTSVIFDAYQAAKARGVEVLLADTAGRLHTQSNLMAELQKIKRVIGKLNPKAPHEILLVLDASIGQNALTQALQFHQALGVTGLVLTKLDGTAKGGILFAIAKELKLPIRFIGLGEGLEDLRPFKAADFVEALFEADTAR